MKTMMPILAALRHTGFLRLVRQNETPEPVVVRPRDLRSEIARAMGESVPVSLVWSPFPPDAARTERARQASANLMDMLSASAANDARRKPERAAE
jgi:hypothetical protein